MSESAGLHVPHSLLTARDQSPWEPQHSHILKLMALSWLTSDVSLGDQEQTKCP